MTNLNRRLGIIGGGNMGEAFAGAMIETGMFEAESITVSDVAAGRIERLKDKYGVNVAQDNFEVFDSSQIVVLAVKPQAMVQVLTDIANSDGYDAKERKVVVSIAAGVPMEKIEKLLYSRLDEQAKSNMPIIRVMPNTPALVLEGMSGMSANRYATADEIETTRSILEAVGKVIVFEEKRLDAVTAVSGSGPAYVFLLIESMIEAATEVELEPEDARKMILQTIKGAVKLMEASGESAAELRKKVTSPGGTTEAALKVFEKRGFKQAVVDAISAATKRAAELSG